MIAPLTLSEFNALVREAVELTLPEARWLTAEVSELHTAQNGHCYLELVQKDPHGRGLLAKAPAHIWRSTWPLLRMHFEQHTGQSLSPGMKVLVQAEASFHELYGYSLNLTDIDPTYTLGDMARRRQEILRQLEADGVLTLNKELPLPRLLQRIAVISSPGAAGYGDFRKQLQDAPFRFAVTLFPSVMQGESVEAGIIAALDAIAAANAESPGYDCVVILRGGGAVSDLQGFESYALAANVAQFPLPVLTGIGHERDDTVVDLVAHTRLKTPTAVAAFLIERQQRELHTVEDIGDAIRHKATSRLQLATAPFNQVAQRLQLAAARYSVRGQQHLQRFLSRMELAASRHISQRSHTLQQFDAALQPLVRRRLEAQHQRLVLLSEQIRLVSPERILRLGYSITTLNGRILKNAGEAHPGDLIETRLAHGTLKSRAEAAELS